MPAQPFYLPIGPTQLPLGYGQPSADFQIPNEIFTATGPIYPCRFVTIDGSNKVRQSIANDWPIGVSQNNTALANTVYAATAGYQLQVYGMGRECWLELGGDVQPGNSIMPDSLGRGVLACGVEDLIAAVAYEQGSAGQLIRVKVLRRIPIAQNCGFSEYSYEYSYEFGLPCNCDQ